MLRAAVTIFCLLLTINTVVVANPAPISLGGGVSFVESNAWNQGDKLCFQGEVTWTVSGTSVCLCTLYGWYGEFALDSSYEIKSASPGAIVEEQNASNAQKKVYKMNPPDYALFLNDRDSFVTNIQICIPSTPAIQPAAALSKYGWKVERQSTSLQPIASSATCEAEVTIRDHQTAGKSRFDIRFRADWSGTTDTEAKGWYMRGLTSPQLTRLFPDGTVSIDNGRSFIRGQVQNPASYNFKFQKNQWVSYSVVANSDNFQNMIFELYRISGGPFDRMPCSMTVNDQSTLEIEELPATINLGDGVSGSVESAWHGGNNFCMQAKVTWTVRGTSVCLCTLYGWYGEFALDASYEIKSASPGTFVEDQNASNSEKKIYKMTPPDYALFLNDNDIFETGIQICMPRTVAVQPTAALSKYGWIVELQSTSLQPIASSATCEAEVTIRDHQTAGKSRFDIRFRADWSGTTDTEAKGWYMRGLTSPQLTRLFPDGTVSIDNGRSFIRGQVQNPASYNFKFQKNQWVSYSVVANSDNFQNMIFELYRISGGPFDRMPCSMTVNDQTA
eukprot:Nk52_evm89s352 gene=Nk52_evmTU89s352